MNNANVCLLKFIIKEKFTKAAGAALWFIKNGLELSKPDN